MAELNLRNVSKSFRGHPVVQEVSFPARSNELVVLLGPSGSGKSTLLRLIAGLEELEEGGIFLDNQRVDELSPRERNVAMVFQQEALYPHLTVRQNLEFGFKLREASAEDAKDRIEDELEAFDLHAVADLRPDALSLSQRRKTSLARAFARDASIFLLDEPLANLDPRERLDLRLRLGRRRGNFNGPVVYATQDQTEAMTLADWIVVLDQGKVRQIGRPMDLYEDPCDEYVASLLGAPPINLLQVQVAPDGAVILPGSDWALFLDTPRREALRRSGLMEAKLGVRSQHLRIVGPEEPGWLAQVEWIETLGNEVFVHCQLGGVTVVVRTRPGYAPPLGQSVAVQAHPTKSILFDPRTQQRVV
ncbi:MAG TPA: ABC transporter ATP-binding protein [Fibrobacteria bacterium]|nr:ABC transporter ATP-binding protein [Fibrobacteria bacterium]